MQTMRRKGQANSFFLLAVMTFRKLTTMGQFSLFLLFRSEYIRKPRTRRTPDYAPWFLNLLVYCIGEESFYTWHCVYTNDESSLCMQGFPYTHHCEYVLNFLQLQPRVDLEYLDHKSSAAKINENLVNVSIHFVKHLVYYLYKLFFLLKMKRRIEMKDTTFMIRVLLWML